MIFAVRFPYVQRLLAIFSMISNNFGLFTIICHVMPEIKTMDKEELRSYPGYSRRLKITQKDRGTLTLMGSLSPLYHLKKALSMNEYLALVLSDRF